MKTKETEKHKSKSIRVPCDSENAISLFWQDHLHTQPLAIVEIVSVTVTLAHSSTDA